MDKFEELKEYREEYLQSDWSRMDLFLAEKVRKQQTEIDNLKSFYDYFRQLYGAGLQIANWHKNGALEPFDNFFDSAEQK
ncbi:hypothetical protein [Paenibacillus sp. O199]|uniref:hypothetical protein n=1 Tax=Paenibacillus sp. O199 TaxID=1643925 RepID=UPI0007BF4321|nr:hypothetical protein [Paenibacillus sp. O199]